MKLELTVILFILGIATVLSQNSANNDFVRSLVRSRRHSSELKMAEYLSQMSNICNTVDCSLASIMSLGRRKRQALERDTRSHYAYIACCQRR